MQNSPIRYTDPTGHVIETPDDLADYYCTDPTYCENGDFKLDPYVNQTGSENSNNGGNILDPTQNDESVTMPVPTDSPSTVTVDSINYCPPNVPNCEPLTPTQQAGWRVTLAMIDLFIFAPLDMTLAAVSVDGALACLDGVLVACLADIPLGVVDYAATDVTVSVNVYMVTSISNGYKSEFEWVITSKLFP